MANVIYNKAREAFLNGGINWGSDTIKAVLVDAGNYTVDANAHQYLSDIPAAARVATSSALTGKTSTGGVADANDVVFSTVSGASAEAVVLIKDTGTVSTSPLLCYLDTGTGLPVTPNGADITCTWDNGTNKIFRV